MTYCECCQAIEGKTKLIEVDGDEVDVCAECECAVTTIPEHDDYDLER